MEEKHNVIKKSHIIINEEDDILSKSHNIINKLQQIKKSIYLGQ